MFKFYQCCVWQYCAYYPQVGETLLSQGESSRESAFSRLFLLTILQSTRLTCIIVYWRCKTRLGVISFLNHTTKIVWYWSTKPQALNRKRLKNTAKTEEKCVSSRVTPHCQDYSLIDIQIFSLRTAWLYLVDYSRHEHLDIQIVAHFLFPLWYKFFHWEF